MSIESLYAHKFNKPSFALTLLVNQKLRHSVKHGEQLLEMIIFARLPTRFMRLKHNKLSIAIFDLYISLLRKVLIYFSIG